MRPEDIVPIHLKGGKAAEPTDLIIVRRHRIVTQLAPPSGNLLIDFGCGNGAQTFLFVPHFRFTVAIDVDEPYLKSLHDEVRHRGMGDKVLPICYDGHRLPLPTGSVDYAISFEVLEHVHSESDALSELHRVLKPGGTLAMSVPNRWWVFETHGAELPLLPWNRVPFFSWLPKRIHDRWARARIYSRREILRKLEAIGFSVFHTVYVTAPMDVLRQQHLQKALRSTVFRGDTTRVPLLSTAILVIARR